MPQMRSISEIEFALQKLLEVLKKQKKNYDCPIAIYYWESGKEMPDWLSEKDRELYLALVQASEAMAE